MRSFLFFNSFSLDRACECSFHLSLISTKRAQVPPLFCHLTEQMRTPPRFVISTERLQVPPLFCHLDRACEWRDLLKSNLSENRFLDFARNDKVGCVLFDCARNDKVGCMLFDCAQNGNAG